MSQRRPLLKLGLVDRGARAYDLNDFFRRYHEGGMLRKKQFRGEKDHQWIPYREIDGNHVRELQSKLRDFGFYPHGEIDGLFGYRTLSAVRLFQEYVRNVENIVDIGTPDGIAGSKTYAHFQRWNSEGKQADWLNFSAQNPTPEYRYWLEVLSLYRQVNLQRPINLVVEMINNVVDPTDTLKVVDWQFNPNDIHLIGIRRHEWRSTNKRENDDLFVLLINGLGFKFYGSTDPNPKPDRRPDEPYIVRGQHRYRFGWHKLSDLRRVYRAFRPAGPGVLICRDSDRDDAFTDADLAGGLSANRTINIHWSGSGTSNWSAGCQVIAGARYVNHLNKKGNCLSYAARNYTELPRKTRGAYNVFLDLLTVFTPNISVEDPSTIYYTVLYDKDFNLESKQGQTLASAALAVLTGLGGVVVSQVKELVSIENLLNLLIRNA